MPQNKLEQLMLNRPAQITGEVQYPTQGVDNLGAKTLDALGVGLGIQEQRPGNAVDAVGGALGAISVVNPRLARIFGKHMIEQLKKTGRLQVPAPTPKWGQVPAKTDVDASVPISPEIMEALEFAQKRWPRLFGQIDNVRAVDPDLYKKLGFDETTIFKGSASLARQRLDPDDGERVIGYTSDLALNPSAIDNKSDAFNTVGHELLHVADNLRGPKHREIRAMVRDLPESYTGASHEIRARIQGARTKAYGMGLGRKDIDPYAINTHKDGEIYPSEGFDVIRPIDSRISGLPPEPLKTTKPVETNEAKLLRLMNERFERKQQGLPKDPRVPNPYR